MLYLERNQWFVTQPQLTLLRTLIKKGAVSEVSLKSEGFQKGVLVETVNPLLRDKYLKTDYQGTYELTKVGQTVLADLMMKLHPSVQPQDKTAQNLITRFQKFLKNLWKDTVWSKVIAGVITAALAAFVGLICSYFVRWCQ